LARHPENQRKKNKKKKKKGGGKKEKRSRRKRASPIKQQTGGFVMTQWHKGEARLRREQQDHKREVYDGQGGGRQEERWKKTKSGWLGGVYQKEAVTLRAEEGGKRKKERTHTDGEEVQAQGRRSRVWSTPVQGRDGGAAAATFGERGLPGQRGASCRCPAAKAGDWRVEKMPALKKFRLFLPIPTWRKGREEGQGAESVRANGDRQPKVTRRKKKICVR